jgi:AcrR family transcriptional regulator
MNDLTRIPIPETAPAKTMTAKTSTPKKGSARRAAVRFGRPPKEFAGEVDERVLDAARKIFLERGFEGASIDEIAQVARSGKQTIYVRFRNKRELFTAVVMRDVASRIAQSGSVVPSGKTIEERLVSAGIFMLHSFLERERIGLMRLAIAETQRFPDLASTVGRTAYELSTDVGARLLGEMTQSDQLGTLAAFAPERLATTARFFLNLVVVPFLMRSLFEENLDVLRAEIGPHVARNVAFFLAACRHGGVS